MTYCPLYRHHDGSSPDSSEGAGRMVVTAGMNRAGGWPESGDVPTALTGEVATQKALPSCKEKAVSGFKSRPAHWVATNASDKMNEESKGSSDVVGVTLADRGDIWLETDLLRTNIQGDYSTGIRTLRWNNRVCVIAGTDDGEDRVTVAQILSPEKAREVGETLLQAAEDAEEMHQKACDYDPEEEKSFLRRLIS